VKPPGRRFTWGLLIEALPRPLSRFFFFNADFFFINAVPSTLRSHRATAAVMTA
jgi:hypothetical protein